MKEYAKPNSEHEHAFLVMTTGKEVQIFFLLGTLTPTQAKELYRTLGEAIVRTEKVPTIVPAKSLPRS